MRREHLLSGAWIEYGYPKDEGIVKKRLHLVLRLRCKRNIDRSLRERGDKKEAGESSRAFKKVDSPIAQLVRALH